MSPLFTAIHPARKPVNTERKAKYQERRRQYVNLEEIDFMRGHSRNLLRNVRPTKCKALPKPLLLVDCVVVVDSGLIEQPCNQFIDVGGDA